MICENVTVTPVVVSSACPVPKKCLLASLPLSRARVIHLQQRNNNVHALGEIARCQSEPHVIAWTRTTCARGWCVPKYRCLRTWNELSSSIVLYHFDRHWRWRRKKFTLSLAHWTVTNIAWPDRRKFHQGGHRGRSATSVQRVNQDQKPEGYRA